MEQLSTPEQLDQQVKIMRPRIWVLFAAVLVGVAAAITWAVIGTISSGVNYDGVIFDNENVESLNCTISGTIQDVLVDEGDSVSKGDILAVISNAELINKIAELGIRQKEYPKGSKKYKKLKDEIDQYVESSLIRSDVDGIVQRVELAGKAVTNGDVVATIVPQNAYSYKEVLVYVPAEEAGALRTGMKAQITPSYVTREEYGYMEGIIMGVSRTLVTENNIIKRMGTTDYVDDILADTDCVEVTIQLGIDEESQNSYKWSNSKGEELSINSGDRCQVYILKSEYRPYELLFNN